MLRREYFSLYLDVLMLHILIFFMLQSCILNVARETGQARNGPGAGSGYEFGPREPVGIKKKQGNQPNTVQHSTPISRFL